MKTAGLTRASFPAIATGTTTTLAVGAVSAATAPLGALVVRLVATTNCYVAFGAAPTATAASMYLPANMPEYFVVNSTDAVAALQVSAAGTLFITPAQ